MQSIISLPDVQLTPMAAAAAVDGVGLPYSRCLGPEEINVWWDEVYRKTQIILRPNLNSGAAPADFPEELRFTPEAYAQELLKSLARLFGQEVPVKYAGSGTTYVMSRGKTKKPNDADFVVPQGLRFDLLIRAYRETLLALLAKSDFITSDLRIAQLYEMPWSIFEYRTGMLYRIPGIDIRTEDPATGQGLAPIEGWVFSIKRDGHIEVYGHDADRPHMTEAAFTDAIVQSRRREYRVRTEVIARAINPMHQLTKAATRGSPIDPRQFELALLCTSIIYSSKFSLNYQRYLDAHLPTPLAKVSNLITTSTLVQNTRLGTDTKRALSRRFARESEKRRDVPALVNMCQLILCPAVPDIKERLFTLIYGALTITWMSQEGQAEPNGRGGHLRAWEFDYDGQTFYHDMMIIYRNGEEWALHLPTSANPFELIKKLFHEWHIIEQAITDSGGMHLLNGLWELLGVDSSWLTAAGVAAMLGSVPGFLESQHVKRVLERRFALSKKLMLQELRLNTTDQNARDALELQIAHEDLQEYEKRLRDLRAGPILDAYAAAGAILRKSTVVLSYVEFDQLLASMTTLLTHDPANEYGLRHRTAAALAILTKSLLPSGLKANLLLPERFAAILRVIQLLVREDAFATKQRKMLYRMCLKVCPEGTSELTRQELLAAVAGEELIKGPDALVRAINTLSGSEMTEHLITAGNLIDHLFESVRLLTEDHYRCVVLLIRQLRSLNQPAMNNQLYLLLRRLRRQHPGSFEPFLEQRHEDVLIPILQGLASVIPSLEDEADILDICHILEKAKRYVRSPEALLAYRGDLCAWLTRHGSSSTLATARLMSTLISAVLKERQEWSRESMHELFTLAMRLVRNQQDRQLPDLMVQLSQCGDYQRDLQERVVIQLSYCLQRGKSEQTVRQWKNFMTTLEALKTPSIAEWLKIDVQGNRRETIKRFLELAHSLAPERTFDTLKEEMGRTPAEEKKSNSVRTHHPLLSDHDSTADFSNLSQVITALHKGLSCGRQLLPAKTSRSIAYIAKTLSRRKAQAECVIPSLKLLLEALCKHPSIFALRHIRTIESAASEWNLIGSDRRLLTLAIESSLRHLRRRRGLALTRLLMKRIRQAVALDLALARPFYTAAVESLHQVDKQSALLLLQERLKIPGERWPDAERLTCLFAREHLRSKDHVAAMQLVQQTMRHINGQPWDPSFQQLLKQVMTIPAAWIPDNQDTPGPQDALLAQFCGELLEHLQHRDRISPSVIYAVMRGCILTRHRPLATFACEFIVRTRSSREAHEFFTNMMGPRSEPNGTFPLIGRVVKKLGTDELKGWIFSRSTDPKCLVWACEAMSKCLRQHRPDDLNCLLTSLKAVEEYTEPLAKEAVRFLLAFDPAACHWPVQPQREYVLSCLALLTQWLQNSGTPQSEAAWELVLHFFRAAQVYEVPTLTLVPQINKLLGVCHAAGQFKRVQDVMGITGDNVDGIVSLLLIRLITFIKRCSYGATHVEGIPTMDHFEHLIFIGELSPHFSGTTTGTFVEKMATEGLLDPSHDKGRIAARIATFYKIYRMGRDAKLLSAQTQDRLVMLIGSVSHTDGLEVDERLDLLQRLMEIGLRVDDKLDKIMWMDAISYLFGKLLPMKKDKMQTKKLLDWIASAKQHAERGRIGTLWKKEGSHILNGIVPFLAIDIHSYCVLSELIHMTRERPSIGPWNEQCQQLLAPPKDFADLFERLPFGKFTLGITVLNVAKNQTDDFKQELLNRFLLRIKTEGNDPTAIMENLHLLKNVLDMIQGSSLVVIRDLKQMKLSENFTKGLKSFKQWFHHVQQTGTLLSFGTTEAAAPKLEVKTKVKASAGPGPGRDDDDKVADKAKPAAPTPAAEAPAEGKKHKRKKKKKGAAAAAAAAAGAGPGPTAESS